MVQVIQTIQTVIETEISPAASIPLRLHTGSVSGKIIIKTILTNNESITNNKRILVAAAATMTKYTFTIL